MKKTGGAVAVALVLALASSCASTAWDKSYPREESAEILFHMVTVKSYNGIDVKRWTSIILPAGEINIGADVYIDHAGTRFLAHDMEFVCYLEAGKKYTIVGAARDGQWGVNVHEGIGGIWTGNVPGGKILEFIPFKNQPDTFI
jgi:hypothetical protein